MQVVTFLHSSPPRQHTVRQQELAEYTEIVKKDTQLTKSTRGKGIYCEGSYTIHTIQPVYIEALIRVDLDFLGCGSCGVSGDAGPRGAGAGDGTLAVWVGERGHDEGGELSHESELQRVGQHLPLELDPLLLVLRALPPLQALPDDLERVLLSLQTLRVLGAGLSDGDVAMECVSPLLRMRQDLVADGARPDTLSGHQQFVSAVVDRERQDGHVPDGPLRKHKLDAAQERTQNCVEEVHQLFRRVLSLVHELCPTAVPVGQRLHQGFVRILSEAQTVE